MGTQRYIDTSFWDDAWIQKLDPSEKFLYLYLLTNPLTNVAGVSELTVKRICFDTGFNDDTVKCILKKYEQADKVYTWEDYIILKNAPKHQKSIKTKDEKENKSKVNNIYKGIIAILNQLPRELLRFLYYIEYAFEDLTDILDAKEIDYSEIITISEEMNSNEHKEFEGACKGLEGVSKTSNYSNSNSNSDLNSNLFKAQKKLEEQFISPKPKKRNSKAVLFDRVDEYTSNVELRDILKQYLKFKLSNSKNYDLTQWNIQLDMLKQYSNGNEEVAIKKVKLSFAANYQSLVFSNELNNNQQSKTTYQQSKQFKPVPPENRL